MIEQDKALQEYFEEQEKQKKKDLRLLKLIGEKVSKDFLNDIKNVLIESENAFEYQIVDKPIGEYQLEGHLKEVKGIWVDQYQMGEDSFNGTVCIQLSKDKYFKFQYYM